MVKLRNLEGKNSSSHYNFRNNEISKFVQQNVKFHFLKEMQDIEDQIIYKSLLEILDIYFE